jgi:hypothetical protein
MHDVTHTYTWQELLAVHAQARTAEHTSTSSRSLSLDGASSGGSAATGVSGGAALYDLYRFFGGVVAAETSADNADSPDGGADRSTCAAAVGAAISSAPLPRVPLRSLWRAHDGDSNLTWHLDLTDLDSPRFHMVSSADGTMQHEVTVGGRRALFWSYDPSSDGATDDELTPTLMRDASSTRGGCVNEPLELDEDGSSDGHAADVLLHQRHFDGSAVWRVAGWQVHVTTDGAISRIADLNVQSVNQLSPNQTTVGDALGAAGGIALFEPCAPGLHSPHTSTSTTHSTPHPHPHPHACRTQTTPPPPKPPRNWTPRPARGPALPRPRVALSRGTTARVCPCDGRCVIDEDEADGAPLLIAALDPSGTATAAAAAAANRRLELSLEHAAHHPLDVHGRRLFGSSWRRFQSWASGTRWCGSGTNTRTTACPTPSDRCAPTRSNPVPNTRDQRDGPRTCLPHAHAAHRP